MAQIRGTREGLTIILTERDFETAYQQLYDTLSDAFFQNARAVAVIVDPGPLALTEEQIERLRQFLSQRGLRLSGIIHRFDVERKEPVVAAPPVPPKEATTPLMASDTLVVPRTLRSGQSVRHVGDVIVLGDVNPGAEVVATGHIVVMGALKGLAHAGAAGYMDAIVVASKLRPTQLRIGPIIARSPDEPDERPSESDYPEVAKVVGNTIEIVRAR